MYIIYRLAVKIQSYDPGTGIITLHHRPSIEIPLPRIQTHTAQRSRKRPSGGISRDEGVMAGGSSMGGTGRRVVSRQSVGSTSKMAVGGGDKPPERRHINGSTLTQGTGPSKSMVNGGSSTIPNGSINGVSRSIKPSAPSLGKAIPPPRASNPPITPTRNHIVYLTQPSPPPLSPIKPLLAASKAAVSALDSLGINHNKRPTSRHKPSPLSIPTIPPPPPSPSPTTFTPLPQQQGILTSQPNYTLQVSIDLTLKNTLSLPPVVEGMWVNVIGYKRKDGVLDAISIFKVKGTLDLQGYERAIAGMGRVREMVEWQVREGIAQGKGLQGGVWD
ncbi:hypothetical protein TWF506_008767 [Arthrobotrys conoides]|uniref:Uncharacterized protein n=1 Tax=Arthrobotrys conoides TaxID=74498 RepID=A0AAN8RXQ2_9PEZI